MGHRQLRRSSYLQPCSQIFHLHRLSPRDANDMMSEEVESAGSFETDLEVEDERLRNQLEARDDSVFE